jgi:hypothetical protein
MLYLHTLIPPTTFVLNHLLLIARSPHSLIHSADAFFSFLICIIILPIHASWDNGLFSLIFLQLVALISDHFRYDKMGSYLALSSNLTPDWEAVEVGHK